MEAEREGRGEGAEQSPHRARLGVSWSNDGVGKGVGSELSPAIAALIMAPHTLGNDSKVEEASPRLSGDSPWPPICCSSLFRSCLEARNLDSGKADKVWMLRTRLTAGCSESQIKSHAEGIVRQSFQAAQASAIDALIVSASPHCGGQRVNSLGEEAQQPELPSRGAEESRARASAPLAAPDNQADEAKSSSAHIPKPGSSSDGPSAQAQPSDLDMPDPLSLAAQELLLLREPSQVHQQMARARWVQ